LSALGSARTTRRVAVTLAAALASCMAAEGTARVLDGYALVSLGLTSVRPSARAPARDTDKWIDPNRAASYVATLPVAAGVERDWFAISPDERPAEPVDPELDLRYRKSPGFKLPSVYEWNLRFARDVVCQGDRSTHPYLAAQLQRVTDLFVFESRTSSPYPTYRYLRNAHYPSGLVTNAFGWRGPDIPLDKPPGRVRIAFVGASTTAGAHADRFSYPEYIGPWLRRWAERRGLPATFDVVNAGREGILSTSIAAVVREELAPVKPDLVVYYEGTNQFWPNQFTVRPLVPILRWIDPASLVEHYSAIGVRLRSVIDKHGSGREPYKPPVPVAWPSDLSESDPALDDPRLPVQLPVILKDFDDMSATLRGSGGALVLSSFVWLVDPGLVLDSQRDAVIFHELNQRYWPFSYAHLRRFIDFENRAYRKYARQHGLDFSDAAGVYPHDPRLFVDSVHMTPAGAKLQAWIVFQNLVPVLERGFAEKRLPAADPGGRTVHPAFSGPPRRLMRLDEIRGSCGSIPKRSALSP
jgi:GDSL-like lipase/acylhydrolase family protein